MTQGCLWRQGPGCSRQASSHYPPLRSHPVPLPGSPTPVGQDPAGLLCPCWARGNAKQGTMPLAWGQWGLQKQWGGGPAPLAPRGGIWAASVSASLICRTCPHATPPGQPGLLLVTIQPVTHLGQPTTSTGHCPELPRHRWPQPVQSRLESDTSLWLWGLVPSCPFPEGCTSWRCDQDALWLLLTQPRVPGALCWAGAAGPRGRLSPRRGDAGRDLEHRVTSRILPHLPS